PWSNFLINQLEQRQCFPYKVIITVCTLLLAAGVVIPPHFIIYGIFGGAFSNIIYTHLRHIARRRYKSTERSFEGNIQSARAISLLVMPHVVLLLIGNYKILYVSMIHAAIILNIIPATLIIRLPKVDPENMPGYSRYQTLPIFSQQMKEMKVFTSSGNTSDIKRSESFSVKEDSSCDETESEEDNDESDDLLMQEENMAFTDRITEGYLPTLTPNTVQLYYSNAGVSILPQIPEEIDEFEETNINVIDPKRLSRISTALEEINRTERRESVKEAVVLTEVVLKPEPINNIEYIPNYKEKQNKFLKDVDSVKKKSCCACSPYTIFLWRRRFRSLKDFFIDFLFNPLFRSLSDLHFYPILFSKVSIAVSYNFFITITPYISLQNSEIARHQIVETIQNLDYVVMNNGQPTCQTRRGNTDSMIDVTFCSPSLFDKISWSVDTDTLGSNHFVIRVVIDILGTDANIIYPSNYFMWRYVKVLVYADKYETIDHLEDNIRCVIDNIWRQILEKLIENCTSILDYVRASHDGHMPNSKMKRGLDLSKITSNDAYALLTDIISDGSEVSDFDENEDEDIDMTLESAVLDEQNDISDNEDGAHDSAHRLHCSNVPDTLIQKQHFHNS
ncbi:uncharacterized protein, partial [Diabrotica undecimpunctata]|uniref:uncharacterized protein n=1 Tax=Diabrotica undecimpunctata TaxID=50387 RepID=UPI003B63DDEF